MDSVAQKTQSPPSVEIDGVPHRQCGEGRKQRRAGSEECGKILPLNQFVINNGYTDGHGLVCKDCSDKQNARYAERVKNALVPVKVYADVPIGSDGTCRGVAIEIDGEQVPHLVVTEACRYWGLDGQAQIRDRIQVDPVLSAGLLVVKITTPKGAVPAYVLRYDLVPAWLAGVETARMRNRERAIQLAAYQQVCAQVLADYFFGTKTAPPPPAQRIGTEGTIAAHEDGPVLLYLDTALSTAFDRFADRLEERLETRARALIEPHLNRIRQVHTETLIDVRGVVYVCKYPRFAWRDAEEFYAMGWDRYAIGWTTKLLVEERLKEYPGKYDIACPEEVYAIKTDSSKLEGLIHERRPTRKQGVVKVSHKNDVFWVSPEALAILLRLPDYLSHEEAKRRLYQWAIVHKGSDIKW